MHQISLFWHFIGNQFTCLFKRFELWPWKIWDLKKNRDLRFGYKSISWKIWDFGWRFDLRFAHHCLGVILHFELYCWSDAHCIFSQHSPLINQWSCTIMYRLMWNSRCRQSCENSVHVSVGNKEVMSSVQYDYVSVRSAEDLPVNWVNSGSTTETHRHSCCWYWRNEWSAGSVTSGIAAAPPGLPRTTSASRVYQIIFLEGWRGAVSLLIEHWHSCADTGL